MQYHTTDRLVGWLDPDLALSKKRRRRRHTSIPMTCYNMRFYKSGLVWVPGGIICLYGMMKRLCSCICRSGSLKSHLEGEFGGMLLISLGFWRCVGGIPR